MYEWMVSHVLHNVSFEGLNLSHLDKVRRTMLEAVQGNDT